MMLREDDQQNASDLPDKPYIRHKLFPNNKEGHRFTERHDCVVTAAASQRKETISSRS